VADLTHDPADDAFHEIQLSGKQLVFLFMATTVISVVIFITGVLVGRSVQAEPLNAADPALAAAAEPASVPETLVPQDVPEAPPADEAEGLDYSKRLEGSKPEVKLKVPEEDTVPVPEIPTPRAEAAAPPVEPPAPQTRPAEKEAAAPASTAGPRQGTWAVQVISLRDRSAAIQIVQRLRNKGYPAFVVAPAPGAPSQLHKVQVGRYGDRSEAQKIDARLKKEEQFDTWIVR
jgi:DedD protein